MATTCGQITAAAANVPAPKFEITGFFTVTFRKAAGREHPEEAQVASRQGPRRAQEAQGEAQEELTSLEMIMMKTCISAAASGSELLRSAGYAVRTGNFKRSLQRLINLGLLAMTVPDKPRSSKQRYVLTKKGLKALHS